MSNASISSKPGSGTTLPSGRKALTPKSEAGYLAQQALDAKAAITATAREMGTGLEQAAHEHPLLAIGLAAVTGALVARVVSPPSHDGHNAEPAKPPQPTPQSFIDKFLADTIQPVILDLAAAAIALLVNPKPDAESPRS
jgi:hypothetical protein